MAKYPLGETNNPVFPEKYGRSQDDNARDNAFEPKTDSIDPDLQSVIDAWPALSDDEREAILAIVSGSPVPTER